jgi:hypothetical protein
MSNQILNKDINNNSESYGEEKTNVIGGIETKKEGSTTSGLNFYSDNRFASGGYTGVVSQRSSVSDINAITQGKKDLKAYGPSAIMITNEFVRNDKNEMSYLNNGYAVLTIYGRRDDNDDSIIGTDGKYLKDKENQRPFYDLNNDYFSKTPTTSAIINFSKSDKRGRFPYRYQDFCFLKYWNLIPNNRLITLRRYAYPVFDNGNFTHDSLNGSNMITVPIAQAVTFFSKETENELSKILSFTTKIPYEDMEAEMHEINDRNPGGTGAMTQILGILSGKANLQDIAKGGEFQDPYKGGPYMNRVFGPINSIRKTKKRKGGLDFEHSIELNFHYVARPIDGVNTKAIMIDIISNLLTLVFNEASFWGGDYRFVAGNPQYPFPGSLKSFYALDPAGYLDSLLTDFSKAGDNVSNFFKDFLTNPIQTLKDIVTKGSQLFMAQTRGKIKPFLPQLPALLTGQPVGEYHLIIGNPMNPIATIGNLVCTDAEFTFGDELGPDDFPLELKVKIKLEHGMPRDRSAIEAMFNRGWGKTYSLPDEIQGIIDVTSGGKNAPQPAVDKQTQKDADKVQFRMALGRYVGPKEESTKQSSKK